MILRSIAAAALIAAGAGAATAAAPLPATVTYTGTAAYSGDLAVLTDGVLPDFEQTYNIGSVSTDFGTTAPFEFSFDFGSPIEIGDVLLSVDNNDDYTIDFFLGEALVRSLNVYAFQGLSTFGFDTFATFSPVPNSSDMNGTLGTPLAFTPLFATSASIRGSAGDGAYGIGEVQFFATSAAVPEPATWAMMIGGIGAVGGAMRRRKARTTLRLA